MNSRIDDENPTRPQRPRVTLQIPPRTFHEEPAQRNSSPFVPVTAASSLPQEASPFVQALYAQRAGDFMFKQFEGLNRFTKSGLSVGEKSVVWLHTKFSRWSRKWFTHIFLFLVVTLYSVAGALLFMAVEGPPETQFLENVTRERVRLGEKARELSSNKELLQDDQRWEGEFRNALSEYEEILYNAFQKGQFDNGKIKQTWTFFNAIFYCGTIYTTIGYGHISPRTVTGRIITIVYAIIGIPVFLILLADFGKLFTRIIKFVWVFVRRLYYTGSCRKVRKTAPAQDVMRGLNVMYDFMRRPSAAFDPTVMRSIQEQQERAEALRNVPHGESPMTPLPENLENYEIDDEFNLPISVAIIMLISYMVIGAAMYCMLEDDWTFFEAFYFVFISISTIGFGDFVPSHPLYMMASIFYLIFGLALTSMCINVVQVKLSDHFKHASSKIIGLHFAEAASGQGSVPQSPSDLQSVQSTNSNDNTQPTNVIIADKNTKNTNSTML